jgi:hypothetical protein
MPVKCGNLNTVLERGRATDIFRIPSLNLGAVLVQLRTRGASRCKDGIQNQANGQDDDGPLQVHHLAPIHIIVPAESAAALVVPVLMGVAAVVEVPATDPRYPAPTEVFTFIIHMGAWANGCAKLTEYAPVPLRVTLVTQLPVWEQMVHGEVVQLLAAREPVQLPPNVTCSILSILDAPE